MPDDQLALAIGKEGLNARLAARLTGWKIDIKSDTEFAQAEAQAAFAGEQEGEDFSGRCAAILSNGKRCPNAALPGTKHCGVPAHQALADLPSREAPSDAEVLAAAALLGEVVEDAVGAGEVTPQDAAAMEEAIEEAAAEIVAEDAPEAAETEGEHAEG